MTIRFCPICGDVLQLVQHTPAVLPVYWQWECPEGDWFEAANPPAEGQQAEKVVDE
ncbi:hypothetical protein PSm6_60960 [Pseudomonas solani]|uniref:Uncharacterized protein n=1 Tax=Pseudomonas solani TaxID=2731552 RepID=A0ABN6C441_9PSED|nr:hypothetical protein [Pseudomonas solani]BCD89689.1 hypothetical protein PSm6_60960 [Pseudomonas solani]